MIVIALNGPPGSGKDMLAKALTREMERHHHFVPNRAAIAWPLRQMLGVMIGEDLGDDDAYAEAKETRYPEYGNMTGRELMIEQSEGFLKPRFGRDVLIKAFAARYQRRPTHVLIVTDLGFDEELDMLRATLPQMLVVRLHREGKSFMGDSRSYVGGDGSGYIDLVNTDDPNLLPVLAGRIRDYVLNILQWKLPGCEQYNLLSPAKRGET